MNESGHASVTSSFNSPHLNVENEKSNIICEKGSAHFEELTQLTNQIKQKVPNRSGINETEMEEVILPKTSSVKSLKEKENLCVSPQETTTLAYGDASPNDQNQTLCLTGKKFVLTGLFSRWSREEMENYIKRMGGHVVSAVSGRTDFLVTGYILENNKPVEEGSKYKKALIQKSNGKPLSIVTEEDFFQMYPLPLCSRPSPVDGATNKNIVIPEQTFPIHDTKVLNVVLDKKSDVSQALWSEKYRPVKSSQIIGNGENIRRLKAWLMNWYDVCLGKKNTFVEGEFSKKRILNSDSMESRACMISGVPGIGKTTAARVVASECNYDIIEYNSSDNRGKDIIEVINDMTSGGKTLSHFFKKTSASHSPSRTVLLLDEMDGLSSGDRGGAQAVKALIEKTMCPVICICNDRNHVKVRNIASKCYDLRFTKPPKNMVAKRICTIALQEHFTIEYNAAELLCERVGNDIRQILNTLQMLCPRFSHTHGVTFDMMRQHVEQRLKDDQVMVNTFDIVRQLLTKNEARLLSLNDKLDAFFVDYDFIPLHIQENYVQAYSTFCQRLQTPIMETIETLASVADSISYSDVVNRKIRRDGCWTLLPDFGFFSTVLPACLTSGFVGRTEFPKWLGKNSSKSKNRRLLSEISLYIGLKASISLIQMRVSGYLDLVYERILEPLQTSTDGFVKDAATRTLERMNAYGLTKQHVFENISALRLRNQPDLYSGLPSSTKRVLTQLCKSMSPSQNVALRLGKKQDPFNSPVLEENLNEEASFNDIHVKTEKSRRNSHSSESSTESDDAFLGLSQPSSKKTILQKNTKEKTAARTRKEKGQALCNSKVSLDKSQKSITKSTAALGKKKASLSK
ncbi:uncharacterized protein LOC128883723 isoform X2 [Hylaeus volcanicus]|nr:uncharacterized protein LOC128883723 isoform X2 [Hylaeus volcanicus]